MKKLLPILAIIIKEWTQEDEQQILDTHQRTPYKAQNEFWDNQKNTL
ncbi:MAG: hypothetical protein R3E32_22980 [Chitinophagales bacterium]